MPIEIYHMKSTLNYTRQNLIVFNLETDAESKVLASNCYWIRELRRYFNKITVVSTHLGVIESFNNVEYIESGGGNLIRKLKAIYIHISLLPYMLKKRKQLVIHYHMSTKSLSIIGIFAKLLSIKQSLWYSHSKADIYLKIFRFVPDYFFSPTKTSFPLIRAEKLVVTNHAIPFELISLPKSNDTYRSGIVSVGRFVKIKHLEKIVLAVSDAEYADKNLTIIGPNNIDPDYEIYIRNLSISKKVNLKVLGPMNYKELMKIYSEFDLCFSGTPLSIDKVAIEAAMSGCFVITENLEAQKLTGMEAVWDQLNLLNRTSIVEQLQLIETISNEQKMFLRMKVSAKAIELNSLESTVARIVDQLRYI